MGDGPLFWVAPGQPRVQPSLASTGYWEFARTEEGPWGQTSASNTKAPSWGAEEDPAIANPGVLGGDTGSSLLATGLFEEERKSWSLLAVPPASSGRDLRGLILKTTAPSHLVCPRWN